LEINLTGMFLCSQRAGQIFVKQNPEGKSAGGAIINMSSGGGMRAHRQLMAYDTTKGGIEAATRAMAMDLAPWKIRVNVVGCRAISQWRTPSAGATGSRSRRADDSVRKRRLAERHRLCRRFSRLR
jgi:NAD(P)-dependent dehydrogenase (short-subunit alcohol dehydrogenase family)